MKKQTKKTKNQNKKLNSSKTASQTSRSIIDLAQSLKSEKEH